MLTIEKFEFQYMDQNSSFRNISINQTFRGFEKKFFDFRKCESLNERTYDQNFRITYSPPERISVIELLLKADFVEKKKCNN